MTTCRNCDRDGHPVTVGGWTGYYLCIAHTAILMARLSFDEPEGEAGFTRWLVEIVKAYLAALPPSIVVDGRVVGLREAVVGYLFPDSHEGGPDDDPEDVEVGFLFSGLIEAAREMADA